MKEADVFNNRHTPPQGIQRFVEQGKTKPRQPRHNEIAAALVKAIPQPLHNPIVPRETL